MPWCIFDEPSWGWVVGGVGQAGVNGLSVHARTDEVSSLKNSSLAEFHTVLELGGGQTTLVHCVAVVCACTWTG